MLSTKRVRPKIDYAKVRKSVTVPDQSLSIQEIVKRFVKGIPVDVVQRQGVYIDQSDHDLEAMSRMGFAEKADMAEELLESAERIKQQLEENERLRIERERNKAAEKAKREQQKPGIDVLDNTMPDDTKGV